MLRPAIFSICVLLCGCASTKSPQPVVENQSVSVEALPPQTLRAGECGVFGWSTAQVPEFIFFSGQDGAKFLSNGSAVALTAQDDEFPPTKFSGAVDLELTLGQGEPLSEGTRYRNARLKFTDENGWQKLVPIAALTTCQAE